MLNIPELVRVPTNTLIIFFGAEHMTDRLTHIVRALNIEWETNTKKKERVHKPEILEETFSERVVPPHNTFGFPKTVSSGKHLRQPNHGGNLCHFNRPAIEAKNILRQTKWLVCNCLTETM